MFAPGRTAVKNENSDQVKESSLLKSSGEIVVVHHDSPPKGPVDKQIHPRHPLPLIPGAPLRPADKDEKED
jgi:hypothetical protein